MADGAESGHACEDQRTDELALSQFEVEIVKFFASLVARQDLVERFAVLLDDPGTQAASWAVLVSGAVSGRIGGPEGDPSQRGDLDRRLGKSAACRLSISISRSRNDPSSGVGAVTCGSRRSNVAASNCDELVKCR